MILPKRDLQQIENLLVRLSEDKPAADLATHRRIQRDLEEEANKHSTQLELPIPELYSPGASKSKKRKIRKMFKDMRDNLQTAWRWAIEQYPGHLSEEFIRGITKRLEPQLFREYGDLAPYRRDNVRIQGALYIPPRAEKVQLQMDQLIDEINTKLDTSIERAAYAHFHIARIHPFADGNGRTSRAVQNAILVKNGLPPAVIPRGEREFYNQLLEDAVGGYKGRDGDPGYKGISHEEGLFFEYIAGKVIVGQEKIEQRLQSSRLNRGR